MRRTVLVLSAAALALTACSTPTTNGTSTPTSGGTNPSPSKSTSPAPEVPKVNKPIDLAQIKQAPCNALTEAQAKELLGPTTETAGQPDGAAGPACRWSVPSTTRPRVNVIFSKTPDGGTASVYKAKGGAYEFVEPLEPIDGYPLTAYGAKDERPSGKCSVALGASDTETIDIALELSEANIGKKEPCAIAREAAIRVLATVRGGN
ncbi:DUF3558 domain-containing protein [Amycolatopsis speibonae]|uniref:DUF3558 domain-containing protein n=1 Tax=Amycolatopsis speibonae TaxID=1450224 RepID=A0ABV7NU41_9PSEU